MEALQDKGRLADRISRLGTETAYAVALEAKQLAAGGAGQHHGERLASRDARQRTSTSTNGGRHSLMLTQLDINCIFC